MSSAAVAGKSPSARPRPSTSSSTAARSWPATGAAALSLSPELAAAQRVADLPDPSASLYPAKRNEKYMLDRPVTDEKINTNYNNFYEFGSTKQIARAAQSLKLRPWQIKLDGMVEKEQVIDIDDLLEEGSARGAALPHALRRGLVDVGAVDRLPDGEAGRDGAAAVVREIRPDGNLHGPVDRARAAAALASVALRRRADHRRGDERAHLHGHRRLWQAGAEADGRADPAGDAVEVRLQVGQVDRAVHLHRPAAEVVLGGVAGVGIRLLGQRQSAVAHPRWSQATEEIIGTNERKPTLLFNGYGEFVADMYKGLEKERLWA